MVKCLNIGKNIGTTIYRSISNHEPKIQQAKKACNLRENVFLFSVFLNLDFIIEAKIQAPKVAHTMFSLIKNMHFHLLI